MDEAQAGDSPADIVQRDVEQAIGAGDMPRAAHLAETALAKGVERPLFYTLTAMRLQIEGRTSEALAALERAQALDPGDFTAINGAGQCLLQLGRQAEALEAFDRAVRLEPRFAAAHFGRGAALERKNDLVGARMAYERAVELAPDLIPALARLAILAARRRDVTSARELAHRVLAMDAGESTARLALAMADIMDQAFTPALASLQNLLSRPRINEDDRGLAQGLLADALDGQGRSAEAFAAYVAANQALRRVHAAEYARPGAQTARQAVEWLKAYFQTTPAFRWAGNQQTGPAVDAGAAGHIFLVGFPRSGTTLLEQVLASHPQVVTLEEHETLKESAAEFMSGPPGLDRLSSLTPIDLSPFRRAYWRRVQAGGVDVRGKVFVDKLPLNLLKQPLIAKLFPKAKLLLALRDPRDVVLSCFRRRFRMNPSMYELLTLEGAAGFYDAAMSLSELFREKLQIEQRGLRYEDLVADFEGQSRAVCAFLGLEWSPSMSGFAERARAGLIATPSSTQVAEGLYSRGVGQWRAYREQLQPVLPVLEPWVRRFGYEPA
jgi:tetratricopeptide (TPR) repeat protein